MCEGGGHVLGVIVCHTWLLVDMHGHVYAVRARQNS